MKLFSFVVIFSLFVCGCAKDTTKPKTLDNDAVYRIDTIGFNKMTHAIITLYIANCFSPEGDGVNDTFTPEGVGIATYSITIVDRWGATMFTSNDIKIGWNGTCNNKPADMGVYKYQINFTDNILGDHYNYSDEVTLLR